MKSKNIRRYYAKDVINTSGVVSFRENGSIEQKFGLTGAEGGGYLDFSDPVIDTSSYLNTIPPGRDSCTWKIEVENDGIYQLKFRYNNPGFKIGGSRNFRDERNCRVIINQLYTNILSENGWLGWVIFSVSGYSDKEMISKLQSSESISGNTCWNTNSIHCQLKAGKHLLTLALEAPPGQAVYDGPNIDYLEVNNITDDIVQKDEVPQLPIDHHFSHEGLLLKRKRANKLSNDWLREEKTIRIAIGKLKNISIGKLDYQPNCITEIDVGPYNNPNIGGDEWTRDCLAAHCQAILWTITKDVRHAEKTIEILNCWANNLEKVAAGNDLKLRFSLAGLDLISAAEIICYWYNHDPKTPKDKRWTKQDITLFQKFIQEKIYNKTKKFYPQANGNWDAIIGAFNMAICVFCENQVGFNECIRQFYRGDVVTEDALSMGALPNYIYANGESQESNRDQIHARMGLTGLCHQAWISAGQDLDLFSAYNNRLLKGVQYSASYQIGKNVISETFISDRGRGSIDISSMCYQIILGWYRKGSENLEDIILAHQKTLQTVYINDVIFPANYWGYILFGNV